MNVCAEIYKTIVDRASERKKTRLVRLPPHLWDKVADDEVVWLKNVVGATIVEAKGLTEPQFLESIDS